MNERICIIGVYFGKFKSYFDAWLLSCANNSTIDFLIFTNESINNLPQNVRIVNTTMEELSKKISEKFNRKIIINNPYKLCDYKPIYGYIFEEYLIGYDYWGHCDFDMIFGDLRYFFDKYKLSQYDKFLPLGHLCLYKNNKENNRYFMQDVKNFKKWTEILFDVDNNYVFDEIGMNIRYSQPEKKYFSSIVFADIVPNKKRYTMCTFLKYYQDIYDNFAKDYGKINYPDQVFLWENKKIFQVYKEFGEIKRREFMYIHIQKRNWKTEGDFSNRMLLSNNLVFDVSNVDDKTCLKKYNKYYIINETFESVRNFIFHVKSYTKRRILKIENNHIIIEKGE